MFQSILFPDGKGDPDAAPNSDERCLSDLNLDQFLDLVTADREQYRLRSAFENRLSDLESIRYRQEVFKDLEGEPLRSAIAEFGTAMAEVRSCLARSDHLRHPHQRGAWFLTAAVTYCRAIDGLAPALEASGPRSAGLSSFLTFLAGYRDSKEYAELSAAAAAVEARLAAVRYCVHIIGSRVVVRRFRDEPDHGAEVEETFARFQQGAAQSHLFRFTEPVEMNPVETRILDLVARLFPEPFQELHRFGVLHLGFQNRTVVDFDREVQFYLAYLGLLSPLRQAGLPFCYPTLDPDTAEERVVGAFDLVLAARLVPEGAVPVVNDFHLSGPERLLVVSGPNQGGKTTFARAFGQAHHLAALGGPIPGSEARLRLCDRIFTHFAREEALADLRGRLEDDLAGVAAILDQATDRSVVIMNETFGSASLQDARDLGRAVVERLVEIGLVGVYVTFVDELAALGPATVSMVSMVVPDDPARRTFEVVRRPADGLAYALAIAEKYGLTYHRLRERLRG